MAKKRNVVSVVGLLFISLVAVILLTWEVRIHLRQEKLNFALFDAIEKSDTHAVLVLLAEGANANARHKDKIPSLLNFSEQTLSGWRKPESTGTALMYATSGGDLAMVRILLDNGADVNARAEYGYTPLLCATSNFIKGSGSVIRLLVKHGADVHTQLNDGTTVWQFATWDPECMKALKQAVDPK